LKIAESSICKAFRLILIGRKRQYEGKRNSVWIFGIALDKMARKFWEQRINARAA